MNYFAHGRRFLDDPYFLAGTAVPDWLLVVDRKMRARAHIAARFAADQDPRVAALARGVMQHYHDDDWFHQTRAFAELNLQFTVAIRQQLPQDDGFRPSLLGHILVEILLDAELIDRQPGQLDRYYQSLCAVEPELVQQTVNRIASRQSPLLAMFIRGFCAERFLYDYVEDGKLLVRLNQVMRRLRLPPLPDSLRELFPQARRLVRQRRHELLRLESAADDPATGGGAEDRGDKT